MAVDIFGLGSVLQSSDFIYMVKFFALCLFFVSFFRSIFSPLITNHNFSEQKFAFSCRPPMVMWSLSMLDEHLCLDQTRILLLILLYCALLVFFTSIVAFLIGLLLQFKEFLIKLFFTFSFVSFYKM